MPELLKPLGDLCTAAIAAAEAAASGVVAAGQLFQKRRVDSDDALAAIGRLADAEHAADAAERTVTAVLLGGEHDLRTSLSLLELARAIERSTDRLAGLGHLLRHHVIAQLSAS